DRAIGALEGIGENELCAERAGDALPLERHLVRHAELEGVAANGTDHRERDTGVATRRIEHDASTSEPAFLFSVEHHPEPGPILHAPSRIRAFDLHPEAAAEAGADASQRNERRVANSLEDRAARALADRVGGEAGRPERARARSVL